VIVVDDGSDDGSGAVARGYGDRILVERQERKGAGAARNRAVELARGGYFAFLDADDRYLPAKLDHQLAALLQDPALDMVFGLVREFVSPELPPETLATIRSPAPVSAWVAPSTMLIRREAFARVGPFSTDVRIGEAVDWHARSREAGLKGLSLEDAVLERRLHGRNSSIRESDSHSDYLHVVRAALERRRAQGR
jgi:glycosyltransferase involved in cell wall biosynthesis